jgi:putative SOS response-associated peptidase YedK
MCGRYVLTSDAQKLADWFDARISVALEARYNIAPTQPVPVVRLNPHTDESHLELLAWGLVPSWAQDPSIGNRLINARAEAAAQKPAFRAALRYRRCLIPADGFYEWKRLPDGRKQPYLFRLADEELFAFAGLWEHWQDAAGNELESCAILTTAANEIVREVHDRMPVILDRADYATWLDPALQNPAQLQPLLRPLHAEQMISHPVSPYVNNPRHDDPRCVEPMLLE